MPDGFRHKAAAAVFCRNFYDVCIIEFNRVIFFENIESTESRRKCDRCKTARRRRAQTAHNGHGDNPRYNGFRA